MKQLFQDLANGQTLLVNVPAPAVQPGAVLIRSSYSLISLGTERMLVDFSKANLLDKARLQPDKVKQLISKVRTDGVAATVSSVRAKLSDPIPLGYCNVGTVLEAGPGVTEFSRGDLVVSNGPHAEMVAVPRNLVAKVPPGVRAHDAAFTVVASIALQGLRLAAPTLGETVVVVGLGLVGQLAAQLARAHGCRVMGLDIDQAKIATAASLGVEGFSTGNGVQAVLDATGGVGADAVLIAASSKTNDIVSKAAAMSRKRGRIVLVGIVGLSLNRADFYEKELSFQVSCSYGPGRYDPAYEDQGRDYPLPYVRWTEKRNFEAVLGLLQSGALNVQPLVGATVKLDAAPELYASLGESGNIATLIQYTDTPDMARAVTLAGHTARYAASHGAAIAVIGAGNFAKATMLPILSKAGARIKYVCSKGGASAQLLARKFGAQTATTDVEVVLEDPEVVSVFIATRHDLHQPIAVKALQHGKHVFVEKPLALDREQLSAVARAAGQAPGATLTVGFNRRFSPLVRRMLPHIQGRRINAVLTFNAGRLPPTHWTHDPEVGGGRVIGEACHFVDLFAFLAQSPIVRVCASAMGPDPGALSDNVSILLQAENGSQGVVNYFANGDRSYPKERVTVFAGDRVLEIDNFRALKAHGVKGFSGLKMGKQDKGHRDQFQKYLTFLAQGGEPLIPLSDLLNTSRATLAAVESLTAHGWVTVDDEEASR